MPANREKPVIVPYIEPVPPDVTAGIFWLKNRDPENWRDVQNVNHVLGKYIISDRPMTEEEWARERATVIDEKVVEELPAPRSEYGLQVDTPPLPIVYKSSSGQRLNRKANAHQRASNRDASGKRLQPWERQAVIDAYRDGEKLAAIAAEFNCSDAAVSQLAKRAGLPRRGG